MEMTGTFGKILASVSNGAEDASMDAETEVSQSKTVKAHIRQSRPLSNQYKTVTARIRQSVHI